MRIACVDALTRSNSPFQLEQSVNTLKDTLKNATNQALVQQLEEENRRLAEELLYLQAQLEGSGSSDDGQGISNVAQWVVSVSHHRSKNNADRPLTVIQFTFLVLSPSTGHDLWPERWIHVAVSGTSCMSVHRLFSEISRTDRYFAEQGMSSYSGAASQFDEMVRDSHPIEHGWQTN